MNLSNDRRSNLVDDWLVRAIIAAFDATGLMFFALALLYALCLAAGTPNPEALVVQHWAWALTHSGLSAKILAYAPLAFLAHWVLGFAWGVVYARWAEPRLRGPGWLRGLKFAAVPCVLSLVVVLPAVGAGAFGLALGAGPLPIIGDVLGHAVYGSVLGWCYPASNRVYLGEADEPESDEESAIMAHAENSMAIGIIAGLVVGALCGGIAASLFAQGLPVWSLLVVGGVLGTAVGALIGSESGLAPPV
jgi:hypothetical protein